MHFLTMVAIEGSNSSAGRGLFPRLRRFLQKPWHEKRETLAWHIWKASKRIKHEALFVRRLEPGFWWIAWKDAVSESVLAGTFETGERKFVHRFLQPGMTVLDIGAYYGLYTLTASALVGKRGRVIAFEPSPFQRKRFHWNLRLNRSQNVRVENLALGVSTNQQTLFSVSGDSAGYASLRKPAIGEIFDPIVVQVTTLDEYLRNHRIDTVDFMKVDVEGGEMDVFKGAQELLRKKIRPVILCELEDVRTELWGYKAKDTAAFVESFGFRWFRPLPGGGLARLGDNCAQSERNFVAVPEERMPQFKEIVDEEACS
jgi:FkbM family methyltransferase